MNLYPLKFSPIYKTKIWGGNRLETILGKNTGSLKNVGESWELSSVANELSVISNGYLRGIDIVSAIRTYKGDLVGHKVYNQFGNNFPLLLKFIDANDFLSIQVHPDDAMSKVRHNSYGKTEMWYIISAEENAELIVGFDGAIDKEIYLDLYKNKALNTRLNFEKVNKGDVFYLPAGRIHAIGPGILLAEIQQSSDITYRIYDWDRLDAKGNYRELHVEQATDAIDFSNVRNYKTPYACEKNKSSEIVKSTFFTTNMLNLDEEFDCNYNGRDSFVALMALEGDCEVQYSGVAINKCIKQGETILIPASIKSIRLIPKENTKLLEVYI